MYTAIKMVYLWIFFPQNSIYRKAEYLRLVLPVFPDEFWMLYLCNYINE